MGDEQNDIFRFENILCAPIVHSRLYFALWVQRLVEEFKPEIIAVEFPQPLKDMIIRGVDRLPYLSVVCAAPDGDNFSYIPIDPCDAIIHAARLGLSRDIPVHFVDLDRFDIHTRRERYTPDDFVLQRIGPATYFEKTIEKIPLSFPSSIDYMREQHIASRLRHLNNLERRVLFVCGMLHWKRIRSFLETGGAFKYFDIENPDAASFLANLHPDSAKEVLEEIPFVAGRFEDGRKSGAMDRNEEIGRIISLADGKDEERLSIGTKKTLMKYLRNLAFASMMFTPDMVDLLTASKNVCGNEFALKVMETAEKYPYFREEEDLPTIRIFRTFEESDEGRLGVKSIKIRRRQDMAWKRNMKRIVLKQRPPERFEGDWQLQWSLAAEHCSYPPEDIHIEDYNQFLRNKVMKVLSEEKTRIEEFSTSIKDGIDLRETIRNWHTEKIYIRDIPFVRGKVGPVTIIFDQKHPEKYPWRTAWYSEHKDESDLIFYADYPGKTLVGPAISKCRFGGYTSIMPPRHIYDFWRSYNELRKEGSVSNEVDLLLYAAIYYSDEKYIAFIASGAPSRKLKQFAESKGRHIVFIPLSSLSPDSVEKLQRFHVLGSKRLRNIAHKYII